RVLTIGGVQTHMIHDVVDRIAQDQPIVRIAQVTVVIDPLRLDLRAIEGQGVQRGKSQRNCSFSRACAAVSTRAPMASMMVRAFSTSCALLAYTPLRKYRLSSRPTRTLPPINTDCAAHGICMRLMGNVPQLQFSGSELTIASKWPTSAGTPHGIPMHS